MRFRMRLSLVTALLALTGSGVSGDSIPVTTMATRQLEPVAPSTTMTQSSEPTSAAPLVAEDPNFDPYTEDQAAAAAAPAQQQQQTYEPKNRKVEAFDFDPSEGLTFFVKAGASECFFQDAKFTGDVIAGAYVVSSADSHIDVEVCALMESLVVMMA